MYSYTDQRLFFMLLSEISQISFFRSKEPYSCPLKTDMVNTGLSKVQERANYAVYGDFTLEQFYCISCQIHL